MSRAEGLIRVAAAAEVPDGRFVIIEVAGVEIGVTRAGTEYYAVRNICPHQGAPIARGKVLGTMLPSEPGQLSYGMDNQVLVCPWHQYEFSLETGRPLFTGVKGRLRTYKVTVVDDEVYLDMTARP